MSISIEDIPMALQKHSETHRLVERAKDGAAFFIANMKRTVILFRPESLRSH